MASITIAFYPINTKHKFEELYILQGTWIMKKNKGVIGEEWVKINDHYLQNRGFVIKGTDTIITEKIALQKMKDDIMYTSTVENQNNQQPVSFRLTSAKNGLFVFENPLHDFPKRISYHIITKDSIHAWIDDGKKEIQMRNDFYYTRAK